MKKILFVALVLVMACKKDTKKIDNTTNVIGYSILEKIPGIWTGPVSSSTNIGGFPEWIVDFRPISSNQVSAKNELDSINDIFMSFFVIKYNDEYKVAFRNGGLFAGYIRNSYMFIDSVYESSNLNFYRFTDPVSGGKRVYTDVTFKGDSLIMHTFTNKFNALSTPVTHMRWQAVIKDRTSAQEAISKFSFPKKEITKDFSATFDGFAEAVFYSHESDPYPGTEQPYLGTTRINVTISNPTVLDVSKKVLIIITSQTMFNGFLFKSNALDFRSRYVLLPAAAATSFTFKDMHPGTYYLNAVYDANGDNNFSSGDYMNSAFDGTFTLGAEGNATANVNVNFLIP